MPKRRIPFVERALKLLKISILMAKMGKPITPRLLFLKKTRKLKKHYQYGFIREYEFSPSSTPLFQQYRRRSLKKRNACNVYSMLFLCRSLRVEGEDFEGEDEWNYALEALPSIGNDIMEQSTQLSDLADEEVFSVDERAEIFIKRFYDDMRVQCLESVSQCREIVVRE